MTTHFIKDYNNGKQAIIFILSIIKIILSSLIS